MTALIEQCEKAVLRGVKLGSNQVEAFAQRKHVFVVEFSGKNMTQTVERESQGIGVRVICDKATGFAYSTQLTDVEQSVRQAVTNAHLVAFDPLFHSLPEPQPIPSLPDLYDPQFDGLQLDDIKERILHIISCIEIGMGTFQITVRECSIVNSNGISAAYKKSDCSLKFGVDRSVADSYCNISHMDVKAFSDFLKQVGERRTPPRRRVKWDGRGEIVIEPHAVCDLIRPLIAAMNGENVVKKQSHLTSKKGSHLVSDNISLRDDGRYPNGLFTQPVDGEGVPSQKTPLIKKGVLKGFIFDSFHAHQVGEKSTGNGLRQGFKYLPDCVFTNVVLSEGNAGREELIADTHHGIVINSLGTSMVNPATPRIALPISKGFLLEKGEITAVLFPAILTGDILAMLQDPLLSREREQIFRFINPMIKIHQ
jgi:PmbA protein